MNTRHSKVLVLSLALMQLVNVAHAAESARHPRSSDAEDESAATAGLSESVRAERALSQHGDKQTRLRAARAHLAENAESAMHLQSAENHAVAVLEQQPNDTEALLVAAQANLLQGDIAAAARYYRAATLADANNATAFLGLGDALSRLGDEPGSTAAFARYRALMGMPPLVGAGNPK